MATNFSFVGATPATSPTGTADFTFGGITPAATLAATLQITGEISASHAAPTFTATLAATLALAGTIQAAQATVATLSAALSIAGQIAGLHPRYRLHGQILDGGVAVTAVRRVRAHKRSTGAVIGEADTVAGVFDIPVGYALDEFYLVPLDLDSSATDWAPPVANRVLSVLVTD